jgi:nucleoside-diphosphate kinase
MKMGVASRELLEEHYKHLKCETFFHDVINFMTSGPVVSMVWQGKDVVKQGRVMLGKTDPLSSQNGTIRGDNCISIRKTACHGSDSVEAANAEIKLWFSDDEVIR